MLNEKEVIINNLQTIVKTLLQIQNNKALNTFFIVQDPETLGNTIITNYKETVDKNVIFKIIVNQKDNTNCVQTCNENNEIINSITLDNNTDTLYDINNNKIEEFNNSLEEIKKLKEATEKILQDKIVSNLQNMRNKLCFITKENYKNLLFVQTSKNPEEYKIYDANTLVCIDNNDEILNKDDTQKEIFKFNYSGNSGTYIKFDPISEEGMAVTEANGLFNDVGEKEIETSDLILILDNTTKLNQAVNQEYIKIRSNTNDSDIFFHKVKDKDIIDFSPTVKKILSDFKNAKQFIIDPLGDSYEENGDNYEIDIDLAIKYVALQNISNYYHIGLKNNMYKSEFSSIIKNCSYQEFENLKQNMNIIININEQNTDILKILTAINSQEPNYNENCKSIMNFMINTDPKEMQEIVKIYNISLLSNTNLANDVDIARQEILMDIIKNHPKLTSKKFEEIMNKYNALNSYFITSTDKLEKFSVEELQKHNNIITYLNDKSLIRNTQFDTFKGQFIYDRQNIETRLYNYSEPEIRNIFANKDFNKIQDELTDLKSNYLITQEEYNTYMDFGLENGFDKLKENINQEKPLINQLRNDPDFNELIKLTNKIVKDNHSHMYPNNDMNKINKQTLDTIVMMMDENKSIANNLKYFKENENTLNSIFKNRLWYYKKQEFEFSDNHLPKLFHDSNKCDFELDKTRMEYALRRYSKPPYTEEKYKSAKLNAANNLISEEWLYIAKRDYSFLDNNFDQWTEYEKQEMEILKNNYGNKSYKYKAINLLTKENLQDLKQIVEKNQEEYKSRGQYKEFESLTEQIRQKEQAKQLKRLEESTKEIGSLTDKLITKSGK